MYKVLFVDDEVLTREAIAAKTPWNEAGYTLIGTAENGKDAIEFMERERPDLLITDIYMPVMDGLELSRYVSGEAVREGSLYQVSASRPWPVTCR